MKKSSLILAFVLLLLGLFSSCRQNNKANTSEYFKNKLFTFIEVPKNEEHYFTDSLKYYWKADTAELFITEQIIISAINELSTENITLTVEILPYFMRQYICFVNEQNEHMIWVNAHCQLEKIPPENETETEFKSFDWRNKLAIVDDGGGCHWNILINIDRRTYSNFFING